MTPVTRGQVDLRAFLFRFGSRLAGEVVYPAEDFLSIRLGRVIGQRVHVEADAWGERNKDEAASQ